jgi:hypothetical protein
MLTEVTCPACGAGWDDADVSCPACGFVNPPLAAADELIASWVVTSTPPESPAHARDAVCVACGYEGPMVPSPDGERGLCPACGDPWQDRAGIVRKSACPDCGQVILLTEQHRGKTIICPKCRSLLGCLLDRRGRKWAGRSTILDIMALAAAFALGYMSALALWEQHVPWSILKCASVVALPITWTLVALRFIGPRPSRRRRFDPPGLAACLAVSAASLMNSWCAWDVAFIAPSVSQDVFSLVALRIVEPLPLATAVAATWSLLILNRRWRPEPSWIDRLGRCLGIYWLAPGLAVPILRLFF